MAYAIANLPVSSSRGSSRKVSFPAYSGSRTTGSVSRKHSGGFLNPRFMLLLPLMR